MVDLPEAVGLADDWEEPPRPCKRLRVIVLEKDAVEMMDKSFHRLFRLHVVSVFPAHQRLCSPAYLALHFLLGSFGDIDIAGMRFFDEIFHIIERSVFRIDGQS